jgi:hypothetical protein
MAGKILWATLFACSALWGFEYRGTVEVEQSFYDNASPLKRNRETLGAFDLQLTHRAGGQKLFAAIEGLHSSSDGEKSYLRFNELGDTYRSGQAEFSIGKSVLFWGSLEGYNLTDVFNTKDILEAPYSPFEKENKLGSWSAGCRHDTEYGSFGVIAKLHEERQEIGDEASAYNRYPLPYDPGLLYEADDDRPTLFLRYEGSAEESDFEYAIFYQNGYDHHRRLVVSGGRLQQYLYLVERLAAYGTYTAGDTLCKFEASVTEPKGTEASYYQFGAGMEHTWFGVMGETDATLYAEYYRSDIAPSVELFQNDLFVAVRFTRNDTAATEWSVGCFRDMAFHDTIVQGEFKRRIFGAWKLHLLLMGIDADGSGSALAPLDNHRSFKAALQYYF